MIDNNLIRNIFIGEPVLIRVRLEADGELLRPKQLKHVYYDVRKINPRTETTASIGGRPCYMEAESGLLQKLQKWEKDSTGYNFSLAIAPDELPKEPGLYVILVSFFGSDFNRVLTFLVNLAK